MASYTRLPNDLFDYAIDGEAFVLYAALLSYAWREPACDPSQARLAEQTGWSRRKVQRVLGRLVDAGLVVKVNRPGMRTKYLLEEWLPSDVREVETPLERAVRLSR